VRRIWLDPPVSIHPRVAAAIGEFDAVTIGPGSFYTSLMPIFLVGGVADALKEMKGPIILIANLLTEGRGMRGFTAAEAVARLPALEHARLGGHTGGNILLAAMERYTGEFLVGVDWLRTVLGCAGRVWPVSVEQASLCAEYGDGSRTRGEVEVDAAHNRGHGVARLWLEPAVNILPAAAEAIAGFDAVVIGPGSFYTSLMPIFLVHGAAEAVRAVRGPIVLVANLLTEGRGMAGFTAGAAARTLADVIGRPIDVVIANSARPSQATLDRYLQEHKTPLEIGEMPPGCELVSGDLWCDDIARHDRRRLAQAVWAVLARRLL
jgi:uncharacterized cofD-like protein